VLHKFDVCVCVRNYIGTHVHIDNNNNCFSPVVVLTYFSMNISLHFAARLFGVSVCGLPYCCGCVCVVVIVAVIVFDRSETIHQQSLFNNHNAHTLLLLLWT
jgi:hypothetical protein